MLASSTGLRSHTRVRIVDRRMPIKTLHQSSEPEFFTDDRIVEPMDRQAIYNVLPGPFQDLACSVEGARLQQTRFGRSFWDFLRSFEAMDEWSSDQLEAYRIEQLRSTLDVCQRRIPYYRTLFTQNGFDPSRIKTAADITTLPLLSKATLQGAPDRICAQDLNNARLHTSHTGGTTGAGLRFYSTQSAIRRQYAVWWRYYRWHGIQPNTWCGYFGGRTIVPYNQDHPPYWRTNWPGRQVLFSGLHLYDEALADYANELRRRRLPWIHGYPSYLALIAGYINQTDFDLGYQPKWVTSGAEKLMPQQAEAIQRAFGVAPRQHYGLSESVANISECPAGRLHVDEDFSFVEFIPAHGPLHDQTGYQIVGTNFANEAGVFVRYMTGDRAYLADEVCPCGRRSRVVTAVSGRLEDYLVLRNGNRVAGVFPFAFSTAVHVREAQIRQSSIDRIEIWIVRSADYNDGDESAIRSKIRHRIGDSMAITFHYVDQIPRTGRGKLRTVVSEIDAQ